MEANHPTLRQEAYSYMVNNRAGALATSDKKGIPHVVIVYCMVLEDLSLYFSTRVEGRKYKNIMNQPTVSMTFYNEQNLDSVQLMGTAERVDNLKREQEVLFDLMTLRHSEPNWPLPPFKMFERGASSELAIIKVTPNEMTYANFKTTKGGRIKPFFQQVM